VVTTLYLVKLWRRIMQMGPERLARRCYVLHVGNLKSKSCVVNLRGELGKLAFGYI
jgi:hypothetical protein